ncbi:MAG TPA: hypothetical protein P5186_13095 [Candidatus Paceibacterota bacterium]|nr:hypothetical protein [Verrucomicrobiota bacterium]HRY48977.1 hypothetical protein [Candidatus Paceibacterota bacterium]HSA01490.1 hypothetical protein [Candidatus Paceibacterota bacterium]
MWFYGLSGLLVFAVPPQEISLKLAGTWSGLGKGNAAKVVVAGHYAFLGAHQDGCFIIDVSNPSAPTLVGRYTNATDAADIDVLGPYAYVVDSSRSLHIVDVSDPAKPVGVGRHETYAYAAKAVGQYVFLLGGEGLEDFRILDVGNPQEPVVRSTFAWTDGSSPSGIAVSGGRVFISDRHGGLGIFDVRSATSPYLIGKRSQSTGILGVHVSGSYAYLPYDGLGLEIVPVSDPGSPILARRIDTDGYAQAVFVSGGYAYVADGSAGIVVIDVRHPLNPQRVGNYKTTGLAVDVFVAGGNVFVADNLQGLVILSGAPLPEGPPQIDAQPEDLRFVTGSKMESYTWEQSGAGWRSLMSSIRFNPNRWGCWTLPVFHQTWPCICVNLTSISSIHAPAFMSLTSAIDCLRFGRPGS